MMKEWEFSIGGGHIVKHFVQIAVVFPAALEEVYDCCSPADFSRGWGYYSTADCGESGGWDPARDHYIREIGRTSAIYPWSYIYYLWHYVCMDVSIIWWSLLGGTDSSVPFDETFYENDADFL